MNEQNYDFLVRQIKYTGFGEEHGRDLKAKMANGDPEFILTHQQNFGKDEVAATLQFRKGESSDLYFFNRYALMLKADQADPIRQTFYVNPKQDNITLKEGYNLLSGRAVEKEYLPKEGEKYKAWFQLDLKEMDPNGQYKVRQFHPRYGFDLEALLTQHPIQELATNEGTRRLLASLQRGNRQAVTYGQGSEQFKGFVEASPIFKTLHFFNDKMQRVWNLQVGKTVKEAETKQAPETTTVFQRQEKKEKLGPENGDKPKTTKTRKKSQKL